MRVRRAKETKSASVSSTVVPLSGFSFTAAELQKASYALITCVTDAVMVTFDGTDPTATLGHPVQEELGRLEVIGPDVQLIKLIRASGDATATITISH